MICRCPQEQLTPKGPSSAYFAWFLRPSQLETVPYFELRMPICRLQLLMQFCMGSHALHVERRRLAEPAIPRHLRRCTLCENPALGHDRHFVFGCQHLAHSLRHCTKMLTVSCSILCGTRTRRVSAIAQQPFSTSLMTSIKSRPNKLMSITKRNFPAATYMRQPQENCHCCPSLTTAWLNGLVNFSLTLGIACAAKKGMLQPVLRVRNSRSGPMAASTGPQASSTQAVGDEPHYYTIDCSHFSSIRAQYAR